MLILSQFKSLIIFGMWNIQNNLVGLSPMDGITDESFRAITAKYGKPSVIFTEFVAAEGVSRKAQKLYEELAYTEAERPIVVQLFGKNPDAFYRATLICLDLGFDGIDLNFGCPAKTVNQSGSGAALMKDQDLAKQIILKTKQAILDWNKKEIPLSVKTRISYYDLPEGPDISWFNFLAKQPIQNITIHGRTYKQAYHGKADWDKIKTARDIIKSQSNITVLGNGDICSYQEALSKIKTYELDGVLIGRAACGNPWVFNNYKPTINDFIKVALEHSELLSLNAPRAYLKMRKHLFDYFKGIENIKELRNQIMKTSNHQESESIINNYFAKLK